MCSGADLLQLKLKTSEACVAFIDLMKNTLDKCIKEQGILQQIIKYYVGKIMHVVSIIQIRYLV